MSPTEISEEVDHALAMLRTFTKHEPPEAPLGSLNPKAIAACKVQWALRTHFDAEALEVQERSCHAGGSVLSYQEGQLGAGFQVGNRLHDHPERDQEWPGLVSSLLL